MSNMLPTAASLLISEDCNLRCKYCFELGSHCKNNMSIDVIHKALDFLFQNAIDQNVNQVSLIMFGGEPLINMDGVEETFRYATELKRKTGINVSASTVTNGTIMNQRVFDVYRKYRDELNLMVQISVDGIKEAHDENRVTIDGKGSFDMIERNLPKWKQIFTYPDGKVRNVCIHGSLSPSNIRYMYESYRYFMDVWQISYIWFMPIHDTTYTNEHVIQYRENLIKIAEDCLQNAIKYNDLNYVYDYAPLDKSINGVLCSGSFPGAPCGAGKNFCTITADGLISPCHHIYFADEENHTLIGDLDKGIDKDRVRLYNEYDNRDMSCYKENPNCDCYGCYRCIADNWVRNGNLFTQIRGQRCMMSHIERDIQKWIRDELTKRGLYDNGGR